MNAAQDNEQQDGQQNEQRDDRRPTDWLHETSPYLRQHAHNPVDWYPWGEEALEKARSEDKPVMLSIGYSACHWCHVMAHESFESDETAEIMNRLFVNVKVDREERPDLDEIYMNAVTAMTGSGGWPMTVFLTPDLKPFYGGPISPRTTGTAGPGFPASWRPWPSSTGSAGPTPRNRARNLNRASSSWPGSPQATRPWNRACSTRPSPGSPRPMTPPTAVSARSPSSPRP